MAGNTPSLSTENWHMFAPSPIETSLATAVDNPANPSAFPLLMMYRAQMDNSRGTYQGQLDDMHATQIEQARQAQQTARHGQLITGLKDAAAAPGMVRALQTGGIIPEGMDVSQLDAGANAMASAKMMGDAGRGLGSAAMGGFTGLAPAAQQVFGPGTGQGPAALVQAAAIKGAGRSGGGPSLSYSQDPDTGALTARMNKVPLGTTPDQVKNLMGGGAPMPTTIENRTAQAAVALAAKRQMPIMQQQNPTAFKDVVAASRNGTPQITRHGTGWAVVGISGNKYPLTTGQ